MMMSRHRVRVRVRIRGMVRVRVRVGFTWWIRGICHYDDVLCFAVDSTLASDDQKQPRPQNSCSYTGYLLVGWDSHSYGLWILLTAKIYPFAC